MAQALDVEDVPTLLVTREVEEHANVFHTMTDLLNVYITTRFLGWGEEQPFHVLLMDNHPPGPLDSLWPSIATGNGTINPVQGMFLLSTVIALYVSVLSESSSSEMLAT